MNIFSAEGLGKAYHEKPLFTGLDISLNEGQKMGLIAANGSGKTTLIRMLAGKETPDEGRISYRNDLRIGYLEQDPFFPANAKVIDCIFEPGHEILHAIGEYEQLLRTGDEASQERLPAVMDKIDSLNGWDYEARAAEVLGKLGIHDLERTVSLLSGGQKKRISLARLLIEDFDLLLLDEPTNHLDLDMIEWLENYLRRLNKGLILITHDRYFLDNICNVIAELDNGRLYLYQGNYAYYLEKKEEREMMERASLDKAKNTYRRELEWMRRQPKARTTKSKARQEAFYGVEEQARAKRTEERMQITMQMSRLGSKILELENICKSYDGKTLLDNFSYTFKRGEKIGLIGRNGAGKSTLLNIIMELTRPDMGKVKTGETVVLGYYAQSGLQLPEDKRVIDAVRDIAEYVETGNGNWMGVSQFLQHFRFNPSKQHTLISNLSGGEKKRLYLLTILLKNPNFLILDEPTNDLDILTLNILEEFLEGYQGCLLMVTHDRYFMDRLVDHVFVMDGKGGVRDIHGNYTDYRSLYEKMPETRRVKETPDSPPSPPEPEKKKLKLSFKEQRELEQLEKEIADLEELRKALLEKMNNGLSHDDIQRCAVQFKDTDEQLDLKTMRWMELQEKA